MVGFSDRALRPAPGQGAGSGGPRGGPFDPMRMPGMSALDANGDGELSAEEIAVAAEALKKLDKNQDGKLTREELGPPIAGRGGRGGPGGARGPGGPGGIGSGGGGGPGAGRAGGLDSAALAGDDAEQKILKSLEEINQKQGRMMNVPPQDGRLLRLLVESISARMSSSSAPPMASRRFGSPMPSARPAGS